MRSTQLAAWCFRCPSCRTWGSTLPVGINAVEADVIDEDLREAGLTALRHKNNVRIVERVRALGVEPGMRVLDVGCAHGWFVLAAQESGLRAEGIEPDRAVANRAITRGVRVRKGLFPDALEPAESFDLIAFNDVLEHLQDVRGAIAACYKHLRPGGFLSINIPNSRGLVFRTAVAARERGLARSLFDRLWQVGLPSPHLWYFDRSGLAHLCECEGFELVYSGSLASVTQSGLWQRAHFDRRPSALTLAGVAAGLVARPVLNSNHGSDIMHLVFRSVG